MRNVQNIHDDQWPTSLDVIGGEPLAGSGFEMEQPELGFTRLDEVED